MFVMGIIDLSDSYYSRILARKKFVKFHRANTDLYWTNNLADFSLLLTRQILPNFPAIQYQEFSSAFEGAWFQPLSN